MTFLNQLVIREAEVRDLAKTTSNASFNKMSYPTINYKQKTILIVEDLADNLCFLSEVLSCYGYFLILNLSHNYLTGIDLFVTIFG